MNEQRWVDKSTWGEGPWQDEPDKINWTDETTGLACMILRGPSGALCGYVAVGPDHPLHGVGRLGMDEEQVPNVHGGVTFTGECQENEDGHGICHVPEPGEPDDVWWIGFDCAHAFDVTPALSAKLRAAGSEHGISLASDVYRDVFRDVYRDVAYVTAECRDLAGQLADTK